MSRINVSIACALLLAVAGSGQAADPVPATTAGPTMQVPAPAPVSAATSAPASAPASVPAPAAPITSTPAAPAPPAIDPNALPPMNFYASVAADELLKRVKAVPAFARLEKDLYGSPIQLRITHTLQPTAGGQAAGLLSAIWAGSTLGLLPVVTNNNLVLTYEIRVNGKDVARYDFERSFTRAINIWSEKNDPTYGLGQEGIDWVRTTADEFAAKAAQDPAVLALAREYKYFFGSDKT